MNNILFCIDVYTVTEGDTLYSIAEKYDLPVSLLMKVNGISDPYNLLIGTRLCIPGDISQLPEGMRPDIQARQEAQHVHAHQEAQMQQAQQEAQAQQASQMQARQAEHRPMGQRPPIMPPRPSAPAADQMHQHQAQDQHNMNAAQVIEIPVVVERPEPVQRPAPKPETAPAPKPKTHTVKAGDTLYLIARMHNIRLDDLMDANPNVDPYNLMIGTILRLPY